MPDAVDRPWGRVMALPGGTRHTIDASESLLLDGLDAGPVVKVSLWRGPPVQSRCALFA